MGMHFGILAARCPAAALEDELVPLGITPGVELIFGEELPDELVAGEHGGRGYLINPSFELSSHGDLILTLSTRLQTLVIGCGAETVSGSYWVFAADNGRLLRAYWSCAFDLETPFNEGDWCANLALEDRDGAGLFELLRRGGFDYDGFFEGACKRELLAPLPLVLPEGPLHQRLERHRRTHRLTDGIDPLVAVPQGRPHLRSLPSPPREEFVEFALAEQRTPLLPLLLALLLLAPIAALIAGGLLSSLVPGRLAVVGGLLVGLGAAAFMLRSARRQPSGVLRLGAGRLVYTAGAGGPIEMPAANLRDFVVRDGHLILRRKQGWRIIINPTRLAVPLATLTQSVTSWMRSSGAGAGFAQAASDAQLRQARRERRLFWYRIIGIGCALTVAALKMLLSKQ